MRKGLNLVMKLVALLVFMVSEVTANVIGFDFGSNYFKITLVVPGKTFSIVENVAGGRKTHNQLTVSPEERFFSTDSFNQMARYPKTTFTMAAQMLGQEFSPELIETLQKTKFVMNDFVEDDRGLMAYQIFSLDKTKDEGEKDTYFTEEIVAMIMKYGRNLAETQAEGSVRDAVITIPSYFDREKRLMMNQCAELAGLSVLQMVHENTAAATYFALERMDETPVNVLFYNMGYTDTEVTVARYSAVTNDKNKTIEHVEILGESSDPALGGSLFDDVLVGMLADRFNDMKENEGKPDVRENARAIKRLYKDVIKIKEVLSANKLMQVKVPELRDYVTLDTMVHRHDFEANCQHLIDRVEKPILTALRVSGLKREDIDTVEILGGGIRVPRVQEVLKRTMNKEMLHVHLNGDEAMAFGATFIATNSSSMYHMRKIYLTQPPSFNYRISIYPIELPLNETENVTVDEEQAPVDPPVVDEEKEEIKYTKEVMLYKTGKDYLGQKKTIQLTYDKAMMIDVFAVYDQVEGEPEKEPELIQQFKLDELRTIANNTMANKEGSSKPKVSLSFELTRSHLLKLNKVTAEITETYLEEIVDKKKSKYKRKQKKDEEEKEKKKKQFEHDKEEEIKKESTGEEGEEKAAEAEPEAKADADADAGEKKEETEGEEKKDEEKKEDEEEKKEEEPEEKKEYKEMKKAHNYYAKVAEENIGVRSLSTKQVFAAKKRMRALEKRDEDKLKNDEAKNSFESLIYEFRGWLNEDGNEVYLSEEKKEEHLEKLAAAEEWLDDDGWNAGYKEYQTRHYNISSEFAPIKNRQEAFNDREELVPKIYKGLEKWRNEIDEITEAKPWITEDEKVDVVMKIKEMQDWLDDKVKEQSGKNLTEDPVFSAKEVEAKLKPLEKLYKKVTNKKKPKERKSKKDMKEEKKADKEEKEEKKADEETEKPQEEQETTEETTADEPNSEEQKDEEQKEENKDEGFKTDIL